MRSELAVLCAFGAVVALAVALMAIIAGGLMTASSMGGG